MRKNWGNYPFNPGKWPFFYGWIILFWASLGILMSVPGQTIGVSVFTDSLIEVLGISRDQLSLAYMFGTLGSAFLLPWAGRVYDKLGVRLICSGAALGLGIVLVIFSNVDRILFDLLEIQSELLIITALFFGFLFLRFFGQGVLTMASRNMMVQWFDKRRGFATGFSNVVVSLAFSSAPVVLYGMIESFTWRGAWLVMASVVGLIFPIIVLVFFRNRPEDSDLQPDGNYDHERKRKRSPFPVVRAFSLSEVRRNYAFWIFALMLAMQALYITGFTFHILSIFDRANMTEEMAIRIFQPSAVIAVVITLVASSVSDFIQLKYLLYAKGTGALLAIIGLIFLPDWEIAYYLVILGNGIITGLFSVLATVTWPRYFGRDHLGAITGQFTSMVVFGSALGPILFSLSLSRLGSYTAAGWACFALYALLTIAAFKADNPQIKLYHQAAS